MSDAFAVRGQIFDSPNQVGPLPFAGGEKPRARSAIWRWVLFGYFLLLAVSVVVPFVATSLYSSDQLGGFREVMLMTSGLSQGLFGILGVVVGYYFKDSAVASEGD